MSTNKSKIDNNFEFPDEISKNVGQISLHFQRLEYVVFEFVVWLLGHNPKVKKEISSYNFNRLVALMDLLIIKELSKNASLEEDYKTVYGKIKNVQKLRNKTIHSSFIITYRDRSSTVQYNIRDVVTKGVKSIKKIKIDDLVTLKELTKTAITMLSDFYCHLRAINHKRSK